MRRLRMLWALLAVLLCASCQDRSDWLTYNQLNALGGQIGQLQIIGCGDRAEDIWAMSSSVVVGRIAAREAVRLGPFPQSLITIEVERRLKGAPPWTLWTTSVSRPIPYTQAQCLAGRREYEWVELGPLSYLPMGQRVLLFLDAPRTLADGRVLRATMGLYQGVFRVDDQGKIGTPFLDLDSHKYLRPGHQDVLAQGTVDDLARHMGAP